MDARKLANGLTAVGVGGAVLCTIWWGFFYSEVIRYIGSKADKLGDFFGCLLIDNAPCALIKNGARFVGYTPYEPLFLWLSGVLIIVALLMKHSTKDQ